MGQATRGILALLVACTVWGLSPLFYHQLAHVPPLEVLSYRCLWSLAFFGAVLVVQGRLRDLGQVLRPGRRLAQIGLAAVMISANWFGYIYAVSTGQVTEASLGYFIFPLVAVALGWLVLGERLRPAQWLAVALALLAVLVLTLGLRVAPWIALALGLTFGAYGLLKKRLTLGPVLSVTAEVALLAPLALAWIVWRGTATGGGSHLLLALSGPLTAGPLILFSHAARRVRLSTLGLGQYLNPALQFLCATLWFAEPFTGWHGAAFGLIWAGLALYSASLLAQDRAERRASSSAGTPLTVVT